jgi:hypothetical protein
MDKTTRFAMVAWVLIFLAFNLYFVSVFSSHINSILDIGRMIQENNSAAMFIAVTAFLGFLVGEIGLIIAAIAMLSKSPPK